MEIESKSKLDFSNTKIAFSQKSNKELRRMHRVFKLMNRHILVDVLSAIGLKAVNWRLPLSKWVVRQTIFHQFVGGENLLDCQVPIDRLNKFNALTILDYGAEGKSTEEELNNTMQETIKAIEFAAANTSVPCISTKITGLVANEILLTLQRGDELSESQKIEYEQLLERVHNICARAHELKVGVFIDAEESWIQDPIDQIAEMMMEFYNKERVIVYNTYQLYRKDKLQALKDGYERSLEKKYLFGAKLVRGAYMEKEREKAKNNNYPSPIHDTKEDTDRDFNEALLYCVDRYERVGFCCASHNKYSNEYLAQLIDERNLLKNHPHLNFSQLYGMSDFITFNLAEAGYNVAKYMPYGPVHEVFPYLIRRAKENSTVTGDVSRELQYIRSEMDRRGLW